MSSTKSRERFTGRMARNDGHESCPAGEHLNCLPQLGAQLRLEYLSLYSMWTGRPRAKIWMCWWWICPPVLVMFSSAWVSWSSSMVSLDHTIKHGSAISCLILTCFIGAIIVSTPQDVALVDARKGVSMFRKVDIPVRPLHLQCQRSGDADTLANSQIIGLLLNMSHFTCDSCTKQHQLFGSSASFEKAASDLNLPILGTSDVIYCTPPINSPCSNVTVLTPRHRQDTAGTICERRR